MKAETLIAAVEHNFHAHILAMKAWPKCVVYDEEKLLFTRSRVRSAFFNVHLRTKATTGEAAELIAEAKSYADHEKTPIEWLTGPETRPVEMGAMLLEAGFEVEDEAPGMAIDLTNLPKPTAGDIVIEEVRDAYALASWGRIFATSFGMTEADVEGFASMYTAIGLGPDSPAQHYLGLIDGEPVGCATVFLGAGAAGIYNIATLKAFRRRGVGKQMTLTAMQGGRKKGFCVGVLQASENGLPLYTGLGFENVCTIGIYRYYPK